MELQFAKDDILTVQLSRGATCSPGWYRGVSELHQVCALPSSVSYDEHVTSLGATA